MPTQTYIYALVCPHTHRIRYIGKSNDPVRRYEQHIEDTGDTEKARWIQTILHTGTKPKLLILERCDRLVWRRREQLWIALGRKLKWPLTNGTEGGDGPKDPETTRRAREVLSKLIRRQGQ